MNQPLIPIPFIILVIAIFTFFYLRRKKRKRRKKAEATVNRELSEVRSKLGATHIIVKVGDKMRIERHPDFIDEKHPQSHTGFYESFYLKLKGDEVVIMGRIKDLHEPVILD